MCASHLVSEHGLISSSCIVSCSRIVCSKLQACLAVPARILFAAHVAVEQNTGLLVLQQFYLQPEVP